MTEEGQYADRGWAGLLYEGADGTLCLSPNVELDLRSDAVCRFLNADVRSRSESWSDKPAYLCFPLAKD